MKSPIQATASGVLFVAIILIAFVASPGATHGQGAGSLGSDDVTIGLRVSEPVVYKNLAVYFVHSDTRNDREYLTLNDGLKQGLVVVTEKNREEVNELLIENKSDKPLFLQEGDRVTGGKQDRTIYSSLVIKAKSGLTPIPTFCVERSRWAVGEKGKNFDFNRNPAYASNSVRAASKLSKNQSEVWRQVGNSKAQLQQAIGNSDKTTSLNESLDSKNATDSLKPFVSALKNAADKHNDLVGVAFAIDGHIQEINVYPGCSLVKQVYPRLLQTYALDAIVKEHQRKTFATQPAVQARPASQPVAETAVQSTALLNRNMQVAVPQMEQPQVAVRTTPKPVKPTPIGEAVLAMMRTKVNAKAEREEQVNADNLLQINKAEKAEQGEQVFRCQTDYMKKPFHLQWLRADENSTAGGVGMGRGQTQNYSVNPVQQRRQVQDEDSQTLAPNGGGGN